MKSLVPRMRALTAVLAVMLVAAACGDDGTSPPEDEGVEGTWATADALLYLEITEDMLDVYQASFDCFLLGSYQIVDRNGDQFVLQPATGGGTLTIELRRDGDDLVLIEQESSVRFQASDEDVNTFGICDPLGGGADPSVTCDDLPALPLNGTVDGELTADDSRDDSGQYYDLYRLEITSATNATIRMESTDVGVDSYLFLYAEDGTFLAQNDDAGPNTFDAEVTRALDPGCHIVEATTFGSGELGPYQLTVQTD